MYRNFFNRHVTQSQRSTDSVLRREREDRRHQEAYLQCIMQLEREVEFLRTSRQGSANGDNQLNQNELGDLQNQDADRDDDYVQIIENESIRQWSFTDEYRYSTIV